MRNCHIAKWNKNTTRPAQNRHHIQIGYSILCSCLNSSVSIDRTKDSVIICIYRCFMYIYVIFQLFICMLSCMKWGRPKGFEAGPGPHCDSQPSFSPKNPKTTKHLECNVKMLSNKSRQTQIPLPNYEELFSHCLNDGEKTQPHG
jgi:hypothetical protein